jgi:hypothetical protein
LLQLISEMGQILLESKSPQPYKKFMQYQKAGLSNSSLPKNLKNNTGFVMFPFK